MSDNGILLGRREFFFSRERPLTIAGWTFLLAPGIRAVSTEMTDHVHRVISLYRESEKIAQLCLVCRSAETTLCVQAVSSDVTLEVSADSHTVCVSEKQ